MAANFYSRILLTGGGTGALDAIDGAGLRDGDKGFVLTTTNIYWYNLDASSGAGEDSPSIIKPDANADTKRWILIAIITANLLAPEDGTVGTAGLYFTFDGSGKVVTLTGGGLTIAGNLALAANSITGTSVDISNAELQQLSNIGATTISAIQWGYLGATGAGGGQLLAALTTGESTQLEAIGTTTISSTQWGYLGALNQGLTTTSNVSFGTIGCGAITTTAALTFSGANPDIIGGDTDGILSITADTATNQGGNIKLYGNTHATLAQDIEFYADATLILSWDETEDNWDFNDKNVKGIATIAVGAGSIASGAISAAFGHSNQATGARTTVFGRELIVSGDTSFGIALNDQDGAELSQANTMAIMGGNVGINTLTPGELFEVNGHCLVGDHGAAATDMVVNVCYGTGTAPAASGTTEGALYFKYVA